MFLRSLTVEKARHGLQSLEHLEGDRAFLSRFATGLFTNNLVFCLDELHEGPEILRGLEGKPCPSPLPNLITQAPVDGLVFSKTDPRLEVCVKCSAHLSSSQVQVEELAAFIEEGGERFVAVFLVQDFHSDTFELSHASSECLE